MKRRDSLAARLLLVLALVGPLSVLPACHYPTGIQTPQGRAAYSADQIVVRLGEFQQATIDAQAANKVATADARAIVQWISGDRSTTPPLQGAVDVLNAAPSGWRATVAASWTALRPRVLAIPALASWVPIVDQLLAGV